MAFRRAVCVSPMEPGSDLAQSAQRPWCIIGMNICILSMYSWSL